MYKKILAMCCICLSLVISHSTVLAQDAYIDYYYESLIALGIETEENSDDYITKGEFCKIVTSLMKIDTRYVSNEVYFRDVPKSHEYFKDIAALAENGYVLGDDYNRFYPDKQLTLETAQTILIRCLGYEVTSQALGGWSVGYNSIAEDLNLDDGIGRISASGLTYTQVNRLIFNTLLSPTCKINIAEKTLIKGDILAKKLYSASELEGVVTQNRFTSLDKLEGCMEGTVKIDNTSVYVGETSADDYLGHRVRAMVIEDDYDNYTIVAITNHKKDSSISITKPEIEDVPDLYTIEYIPSGATTFKTVHLDRNVSVIYNYQKLETYTIDDLKIDSGDIELIDNDKDGIYEVAVINEYKTYVVAGVDASSGEIYDKYGYSSIDVSEDAVILNSYNYEIDISAISQNSVLSVYIPKNTTVKYYTVVMVSGYEPIEGSVTAIGSKGDYKTARVNGEEYLIDPRYEEVSTAVGSRFREIAVKSSGMFLINKDGMICGLVVTDSGELYGYLKKISFDETDEDKAYFEIFSQNGEFVSGEISEKIKVNGSRLTKLSVLKSNSILFPSDPTVVKPQLVKFEIDKNGMLSTLKVTSTSSPVSPMLTDDKNFTYNGKVDNGEFRDGAKKYAYKYLYDDSTVIFNVPAASDISDKTKYSISNKSFSDGYKMTLELYDVGFDYIIGAALSVAGTNAVEFANQQSLTIVESVGEVYDSERDEAVKELIGTLEGAKVRYICSKDDTFFDGFKRGDFVRIVVDGVTKEVIGAAKIFTFDNAGASADTDAIIYHDKYARKLPHASRPVPTNEYDYGLTMVYGRCIAKGNNTIALTMDSGVSAYANMIAKDAAIYVVEYSDRGVNVTKTSRDAIIPSASITGIGGNNVLLNIRNALAKEVFIIKEY